MLNTFFFPIDHRCATSNNMTLYQNFKAFGGKLLDICTFEYTKPFFSLYLEDVIYISRF